MGILAEDMKRVVREQRLGYVATVCPDGTPNLSPKGTTAVWDDDHLVFADICSPGTIANLAKNPAVEINVVDPIARKGYRFKGSATVVTEGVLFERAMTYYRREHGLADGIAERIRHIVVVKITRALPLVSPVYDDGTTEGDVVRKWSAYYDTLRLNRSPR
jgi:predicted pyridoxine 5'-phosphate oxidase superfamily flavin-nucleotide-binding protein